VADVYVSESRIHGVGVFAARDFAAGEVALRIDDSRIVDADHPLRPELGEREYHRDYLAGGRVVLMQWPERHINSSCDPNTFVKTVDSARYVVTRRAVKANEELTYDYIIDCHGGEIWNCNCRSPRCRGTVPGSFFELPRETQREYLPLLNEWFVNEHRDKVEILRQES
jgi:SET domain-containing protein